ncbi:MAG TPA: hypothetical protein VEX65_01610 [Flavisolibacter sp.]|nr:hypothetical protein [Flavisolibacter sp.]
MSEKSLEAELLTLKATIIKSEALYKTSILNHKEFSKVKVIYMKIKLLKISYASLLRKANQQKENRLLFKPKKANQLIEEGMMD